MCGIAAIFNYRTGQPVAHAELIALRDHMAARGPDGVGEWYSADQRVGLGHRMTHKPTQLSVGEQQRVAVARALANRPKLLLADEPTANVDSGHQQQILDLLSETCREEKVSLVLVTHAPQVAQQFDRVERLEEFNKVGKKS